MNVQIRIMIIMMVLLGTTISNAQKNVDHQNLLWTRYALKLKINDSWSVSQEIEERTYWFPWRQHQFVTRTMGRYNFKNGFGVGAGFAYFRQSLPQDPEVNVNYTQPELRSEFELTYTHSLSEKLSMNHRYWNELRYFKEEGQDYEYGNMRLRYRLELQYKHSASLTFRAFDEIFINLGENIVNNTFDQNRYGASIQYMPIKNFGLELGYINWFQQRPSGVDFYNRNIVRVTVHHTIDVSKKSK
ncbi:DUF2490 domain-containing protein [Subsaxibacter sp. CAU 1640]|uniref:DUF2490 domain-containing protein n=1 Tax=Subsaxibacter sp. CAU 1640 TaxID=2933271 RepID=UPI002005D6CA|nr:DUF2490 domain-containing protein [Subsaxibacter sp. CAU 1640]MCK7591745.1 DUF2490 domain-containing protein [Subsaxibacter sp. CAU 1640]